MSQIANCEMEASVQVAAPDPDFIVYLLDPEQEYNCYFLVGNPELGCPEKIGVVKKMLVAHSVMLRVELQDSMIAEKGVVKVKDLFPETFKNFLRYVYGYDNIDTLNFEEADNLLYAANKYMMPKLKNRLATRLMSMLDYSNICSLMNNLACYTVLELDSAITEILQLETDRVLDSLQFLGLSSTGFLKILEQEILNVDEIELWRAALNWAKNQGMSENGQVLRNQLTDHLKLIRVCSMADDEIMEVISSKVLTYDEIILVSKSSSTGEVQPSLTTICNMLEKRERPLVKSELLEQSLHLNGQQYSGRISESTIQVNTANSTIELCSVELLYLVTSHRCNCVISIQKNTEPPIVVRFNEEIQGPRCTIPLLYNAENVQLLTNSSYSIKLTFSCSSAHRAMCSSVSRVTGNHFSVQFRYHPAGNSSVFHVGKIFYKTVTKNVKSA